MEIEILGSAIENVPSPDSLVVREYNRYLLMNIKSSKNVPLSQSSRPLCTKKQQQVIFAETHLQCFPQKKEI